MPDPPPGISTLDPGVNGPGSGADSDSISQTTASAAFASACPIDYTSKTVLTSLADDSKVDMFIPSSSSSSLPDLSSTDPTPAPTNILKLCPSCTAGVPKCHGQFCFDNFFLFHMMIFYAGYCSKVLGVCMGRCVAKDTMASNACQELAIEAYVTKCHRACSPISDNPKGKCMRCLKKKNDKFMCPNHKLITEGLCSAGIHTIILSCDTYQGSSSLLLSCILSGAKQIGCRGSVCNFLCNGYPELQLCSACCTDIGSC